MVWIEVLKIQPELRVGVEVSRQPQGSLRGDAAPFVHNFTDACSRDMQLERQLVDGEAERLHKILTEDFPRMDRRHQRFRLAHVQISPLLVIIAEKAQSRPRGGGAAILLSSLR